MKFITTAILMLAFVVSYSQTVVGGWTQLNENGDTVEIVEYFMTEPAMTIEIPDSIKLIAHDQFVMWGRDDLSCFYTNLIEIYTEEDSLLGYQVPISVRFGVIQKMNGAFLMIINIKNPFTDYSEIIVKPIEVIYPVKVDNYRKISFFDLEYEKPGSLYASLDNRYNDFFFVYKSQSFLFENSVVGFKNF